MRTFLVASIVIACCACNRAPKERWIEQFEPAVTDALCVPEQFLVSCFVIDEQRCKAVLRPHVKQCVSEVRDQIPDQMKKEDGEKFGGMIGACAATRAEMQLASEAQRRFDTRCSDPTAWTH